jgi:hypothetical protein
MMTISPSSAGSNQFRAAQACGGRGVENRGVREQAPWVSPPQRHSRGGTIKGIRSARSLLSEKWLREGHSSSRQFRASRYASEMRQLLRGVTVRAGTLSV